MSRYLANLLINRDYALFMGGSFVSATGTWFLVVAIGWLLWEIGKSEFLLGVGNFAQMGPLLILGLFGGVLADRLDRRRLIFSTQLVIASASVILAVVALTEIASVGTILALLLAIGISQAFTYPAWSPYIADLVGPDRLRAAVALNSARFNLTRVIGPAVAGILLAQVGAGICIALAAASQVALIVSLAVIRSAPCRVSASATWMAAIREGLQHTWGTPTVRQTMLVAAALGTFTLPYIVFLPAYAQNILRIGPEGLGLLFTAVGAGAIAGAAISGSRLVGRRPGLSQGLLASMTGMGLTVFALSTSPAVSMAALFSLGLGSIGYYATANATVQLAVPRAVVGRVMGVWVVVGFGTTPLGGIILGAVAERAGLPGTLAVAGLFAVFITTAVMIRAEPRPAPMVGEERAPRSAK